MKSRSELKWLCGCGDGIGGAEGDRTPDLMTASSSQVIFLKPKQLNGLQPALIFEDFPFRYIVSLNRVGSCCRIRPQFSHKTRDSLIQGGGDLTVGPPPVALKDWYSIAGKGCSEN
jgi:hypothetical protein